MPNRKCLTSVLFASLVLMLLVREGRAAESGGVDWPRWRGKNFDGKVLQDGVFKDGHGLKVAWKKPLGSGYSSVSIAGGRAVTMFSDSTFDYVVAFDADSGEELWRHQIDSTYVGHNGSHNGQISTPTLDGDKVFVYARKGQLLALDASNGRKIWSKNMKDEVQPVEPFHGFGTSPLVAGDILVCQVGDTQEHTVCGFQKDTGELLWTATSDTINYQSPIVATILGEEQIIGVADDEIFGLSLQSGDVLWRYEHNGQNGSTNPVVIDEDKIFLNQAFGESSLIRIEKSGPTFRVEELWKNRNIRQTFNTTVYHQGHLYGFSGRFLTCVDAQSGETVWKSRPPGDGFLILVDNHLVILTKAGTMHVAQASPQDYIEVASTEVFDGLTWSPPSFAYGKLYARNLFEIASIDIAPVDQLTLDEPEVEMVNPNGEFAKFVNSVQSASVSDKPRLIEQFLQMHPQSPLIEDARYAHIFFNGEAKDLAVVGDFLNAGQEAPMHRIDDTDFFYYSVELEPDARMCYQLRKDFDTVIADPLNPHQAPGGPATLQGVASELRMPEFTPVTHFEEPKGSRGEIESFQFESDILGNERQVHVYLPVDYQKGTKRYPVLYVHYGNGAKDQMMLPNTLDNLINNKKVTPVIAVFIESPRSFQEYSRNLRDQHVQMFAEELVPYIDEKYRTVRDANARVILGGDEGGFAAFYAAFKYPEMFHNVAGQSTHLHKPAGGDALTQIVRDSGKLPINIYMDWGTYDLRYNNGLSWVDLNQEFVELLREEGYSVTGGQVNDGFGWASWRMRADKILEHFFSQERTQK